MPLRYNFSSCSSDRNKKRALEVEGGKSYYGTSTASPNTRDALTGEIHETRVIDIARGALVANALPNIDWVMPMGSSQDVPAFAADLHEFEAVVKNTTKPLVFPPEVVDRMFIAADLFMPQIPGPTEQLGATAPVTLAGALALAVAEGLLSLTLVQLRRSGAPCFLSANVSGFDMATTTLSIASPEMSLGLAAQAEIAQSFGLPSWGLAGGSTDTKVLDAQAGIESAFSILAQGLGGLNLIHDIGYMNGGMICSAEMLVLGNEVVGMAKRFIRGIEVTPDTLARDVIQTVGPGGNFLQEEHTFRHFRQELWRPTLLSRQPYGIWQKAGSKDMAMRVREKVKEILDTHKIAPLPDATLSALEKLKRDGEKELIDLYAG